VEGGGRVLQSFIDSGTVDQWHRFTSKEAINEGIPAPESNHNLKAAYKLGKDRYERG
jgi:riboflavin biosynthesis pyrimidine reductase